MLRLNKTYKQQRFRYSALARCVAWANISVQVLFPLAVTFTLTMAARAVMLCVVCSLTLSMMLGVGRLTIVL